jgi:gas vesicle protein
VGAFQGDALHPAANQPVHELEVVHMAGNDGGRFMLGFWIGALAGAAAALLLAPYPGEEMRKQLQEKGTDWGEQVKDQADRLAEQARTRSQQFSGDVREQAGVVQERGRVVISDGARWAQQALDSAQSGLNRAADTAQEKVAQIVETTKEKTGKLAGDVSGAALD